MEQELQKFINSGFLTEEEARRIENEAKIDAMRDIDEETKEAIKGIERDFEAICRKCGENVLGEEDSLCAGCV